MLLRLMLICIPLALVARWLGFPPLLVFGLAAVSVMPLAELMGEATEVFARRFGPTVGGLLNATLGIAPEVIICILGLRNGLHEVVKASITGSILANLLLGLGLAMVIGGRRHGFQSFDKLHAGLNAGLLVLASIGLIVPAVFHHISSVHDERFSIETALVLLVVYGLSVWFTLKGGQQQWETPQAELNAESARLPHTPHWSQGKALGILAAATCTLALVSEVLTASLEPAAHALGLSATFSGVVLLAIVGNAGEILNAVRFAREDQMDVAFSIAVGAGIQIALMVAPLLVLVSLLMGRPMNLVFTPFEVISVVIAVIITARLTSDGKCHWMEGVLLLGVYAILALAFFDLPDSAAAGG
jgi:Ca2+:H+ antiporter